MTNNNEHRQFYLEHQPTTSGVRFGPDTPDFHSSPSDTRTDKNLTVKQLHVFNEIEYVNGVGQKVNVTGASSTYYVNGTDFVIGVTSVATIPDVVIPSARHVGVGKTYVIKDMSGSASATTITITNTGSDTINGDANSSITSNYGSVRIVSDGAAWFTY